MFVHCLILLVKFGSCMLLILASFHHGGGFCWKSIEHAGTKAGSPPNAQNRSRSCTHGATGSSTRCTGGFQKGSFCWISQSWQPSTLAAHRKACTAHFDFASAAVALRTRSVFTHGYSSSKAHVLSWIKLEDATWAHLLWNWGGM